MKTTRGAQRALRAAEQLIAGIDDQVRLEILAVALLNAGWTIRTQKDESGVPVALWAYREDANVYVPFGDMGKKIVISRDADEDRTPAWAGFFDQEAPVTVLLAVAELVAQGA